MSEIPHSRRITEAEELFDVSFREFAFAEAVDRAIEENRRRDPIPDEDLDFHFVPRASLREVESEKLNSEGDLKRTSSSESSKSGDLDGIPAEIYCAWDPTINRQSQQRKSLRTWLLLDSPKALNSRTSETLVRAKKSSNFASREKNSKMADMDAVTAYRIFYGDRVADKRRSFLPYRQDLLGIFACPSGSPARSLFAM